MSLYDDVKNFLLENPDNIIKLYHANERDNSDTSGTSSVILGYMATIFQPDDVIILRYPSDSISEVKVEYSLISLPSSLPCIPGISEPKRVYGYNASVYYGLNKRQLYLTGKKAQQLFNLLSSVRTQRIETSQAKLGAQYAQEHYEEMYTIMHNAGYTYNIPFNNRIKSVKSTENQLFNLMATYIINCESYQENQKGFLCKTGETGFYFGEDKETEHDGADKYMNRVFGFWNFHCKNSGHVFYSETSNPYAFSGLAHKFIELADYVHNDSKRFIPSSYVIKYLRENNLCK